MKARRLSLTLRKPSGSISLCRENSMPLVSRCARASQSSSTSLGERKVPVVSSTCDSTMKNPDISCVSDGRADSGKGVGKIKSDWACGSGSEKAGGIFGMYTCLSVSLVRLLQLAKRVQCRVYMYTLEKWFEIYMELVIVKNIDWPVELERGAFRCR